MRISTRTFYLLDTGVVIFPFASFSPLCCLAVIINRKNIDNNCLAALGKDLQSVLLYGRKIKPGLIKPLPPGLCYLLLNAILDKRITQIFSSFPFALRLRSYHLICRSLLLFGFLRQALLVEPRLASVSQVLGLQVCTTTPGESLILMLQRVLKWSKEKQFYL
jgi:hypothetical protein